MLNILLFLHSKIHYYYVERQTALLIFISFITLLMARKQDFKPYRCQPAFGWLQMDLICNK